MGSSYSTASDGHISLAIVNRLAHRLSHPRFPSGGGDGDAFSGTASGSGSVSITSSGASGSAIMSRTVMEEMADAFDLGYPDVEYIQRAWPSIEHHILPVGIKVFVSVLETKKGACQKNGCSCVANRAAAAAAGTNSKKGKAAVSGAKCCPSQAILNEEVQQFFLVFVGLLRRTIKNLNNPRACASIVRKVTRRQLRRNRVEVDKLINDDTIIIHFCRALREVNSGYWTAITEASYATLISAIFLAVRRMRESAVAGGDGADDAASTTTTSTTTDEENDDDDTDAGGGGGGRGADGDSDEDDVSVHSLTAADIATKGFAAPLLLFGCQTFQEFFELRPEALELLERFCTLPVIPERVTVADLLKVHATRVLALADDIVAGHQDKIRVFLHDLGRQHFKEGFINEEHVDMMGPVICHTIRPLAFKSGLWSVEVEKSWNALFDTIALVIKSGYRSAEDSAAAAAASSSSSSSSGAVLRKKVVLPADPELDFPSLTQVILLRETWIGITEQMNELGLTAAVKLFRINYNLRFSGAGAAAGTRTGRLRNQPPPTGPRKAADDTEHFSVIFNLLLSIIDHIISTLPNSAAAGRANKGTSAFSPSAAKLKQLQMLREPMDWVGQVFCNTVRPLLLVQGKWSYQVEMSWKLLFKHLVKKNKREDDDDDDDV